MTDTVVASEREGDRTRAPTVTESCHECDGPVIRVDREDVCEDCGLVLEERRIARTTEIRQRADGAAEAARTGPVLTESLHDRGLSTTIGWYRDGNGNHLDGGTRNKFDRLRMRHKRAVWGSKRNRNLGIAFAEISRIAGALDCSRSVIEQASQLFRSAQSDDLIRGNSIEAMAAAAVYATCRCTGVVRALSDVGDVAQVPADRVEHAYGVLNEGLGLTALVQRPVEFVPAIADECTMPTRVERRALELARIAEESGIANGCRPSGVAGGAVWLAAQELDWIVTQSVVADAAGSTPVTVRKHYQALQDVVDGDLDE